MKAQRTSNGRWECKTYHLLDGGKQLQVWTYSHKKGYIVTMVHGCTIERGTVFITYGHGGDFNLQYSVVQGRGTEANIEKQHEKALVAVDSLVERANAYYRSRT